MAPLVFRAIGTETIWWCLIRLACCSTTKSHSRIILGRGSGWNHANDHPASGDVRIGNPSKDDQRTWGPAVPQAATPISTGCHVWWPRFYPQQKSRFWMNVKVREAFIVTPWMVALWWWFRTRMASQHGQTFRNLALFGKTFHKSPRNFDSKYFGPMVSSSKQQINEGIELAMHCEECNMSNKGWMKQDEQWKKLWLFSLHIADYTTHSNGTNSCPLWESTLTNEYNGLGQGLVALLRWFVPSWNSWSYSQILQTWSHCLAYGGGFVSNPKTKSHQNVWF